MRVLVAILATAALLPAGAAAQGGGPPPVHTRGPDATQARPLPRGGVLWTNPLVWNWVQSGREDTLVLIHAGGEAQTRAIVSEPARPSREMLDATLERVRRLDPKARLMFEEPRRVNGAPVLCVQLVVFEGDPQKETVFYGYLHAGESRSTEIFTIAPRLALGEMYAELTALLDGFEPNPASAGAEGAPGQP